MTFKFESTKKLCSLFNWSEIKGNRSTLWGEQEEVFLEMRTWRASQMKVIASCGKMDYIYIRIPISLFFTDSRYVDMCFGLAENMNLKSEYIEVIQYDDFACFITGIKVSAFIPENKIEIQNIIEKMAEYVIKFRRQLDDWGYTDQDTDFQ